MTYDQVVKGAGDVSKALKQLDDDFKKNESAIKQYWQTTDKLAQQKALLTKEIQQQQGQVEKLKTSYEEQNKTLGKNNETTQKSKSEYESAGKSIADLEEKLKDTNGELKNQDSAWKNALEKVVDFKKESKDAAKDIEKLGESLSKLGKTLTDIAITSAKMFLSYEDELAKVLTLVDTSIMPYEEVKKMVLEISNGFNIATEEIAKGFYELIMAGVELEDVYDALRSAAILSTATQTDMASAIDIIMGVTKAYNLEAREQAALVDQVVAVYRYGKFPIEEFAGSIEGAAKKAVQAGVSQEELLSVMAALTAAGMPLADVFSTVDTVLQHMIDPADEARVVAEQLGFTLQDSGLQAKGFEQYMAAIARRADGDADAMNVLCGGIEATGYILDMTSQSAQEYGQAFSSVTNSTGSAKEAMDNVRTPSARLNHSLNQLQNALVAVGEAFSPVITVISLFVKGIANISPGVIGVIGVVGALMLTMGGLVKVLSTVKTVTEGVVAIKTILLPLLVKHTASNGALAASEGGLAATGAALSMANFTLAASFTASMLSIIAITAAILALVVAFAALFSKQKDVTSGMKEVTAEANKMNNQLNNSIKSTKTSANNMYAYAKGTMNHPGGMALVGEAGPELVNLPKGSQVYTAAQTKSILAKGSTTTTENKVYNLNLDLSKFKSMQELESFLDTFEQSHRASQWG